MASKVIVLLALACVVYCELTPVGVFTNVAQWTRARERIGLKREPYYSMYLQILDRAKLDATPTPFRMLDMTRPVSEGGIFYGWNDGGANSLSDACSKLTAAGTTIQAYALAYKFTGEKKYAEKLVSYVTVWAKQHTPVNMYDFHIDFANSNFDGKEGESFQTGRAWNFALDSMWQTYGLMSISDAYVLLKQSGYKTTTSFDTLYRNWIKNVTSAVNAGFHSWTRWADTHAKSNAATRYRSDNHLSWAQTGLIAAGVALGDAALVNYTLYGGAWKDIKAPLYSNPSHFREMISKAIQPNTGLMYEQLIRRTPLIGYSYFHIQALMEIAQVGEINTGQNLFGYVGRNGSTLKLAYNAYAKYALGTAKSTDPEEADSDFLDDYGWLYELAYNHWPTDTNFKAIVSRNSRGNYILQGMGPYSLFWAEDIVRPPQTFYPGVVGPSLNADTRAISLGLKFTVNVAGTVSGLKVYRYSGTTLQGGYLYNASGHALASLSFSASSATGFTTASFSKPVAIKANTVYVASYFAPQGRYAIYPHKFDNQLVEQNLRAPIGAGVYKYGSTAGFPTSVYQNSQYYVSPVFVPY